MTYAIGKSGTVLERKQRIDLKRAPAASLSQCRKHVRNLFISCQRIVRFRRWCYSRFCPLLISRFNLFYTRFARLSRARKFSTKLTVLATSILFNYR